MKKINMWMVVMWIAIVIMLALLGFANSNAVFAAVSNASQAHQIDRYVQPPIG